MQLNQYIPGVPASKCAAVRFVCAVSQCGTRGKTCVRVQVCTGMGSGCAVWKPIPAHTPTCDLHGLPIPVLLPSHAQGFEKVM